MGACENGHIDTARMLVSEFHANVNSEDWVRAIMCFVAVCVVVVVGNVVVVAAIGRYLVSIFVTLICIISLLLHYCVGVLMML